MSKGLNESAVGYGTFWLDFAEAFASGRLRELTVECPTKKDAYLVRQEFYSFRMDAKDTYPELLVLKAALVEKVTEGGKEVAEVQFMYRDRTITSQLLQSALVKAGVMVETDMDGVMSSRWRDAMLAAGNGEEVEKGEG